MKSRTSVRPTLARVINDRLTLDLIAANGPMSRAEIKAATGLSQPSMFEVVGRLQDSGHIIASGESDERKRGRNAQLYDLTPTAAAVGVRVDGDEVHAVVTDLRGSRLGDHRRPVDDSEPAGQIAATVHAAVAAARADVSGLGAVVVGVHGLVEPDSGDLGFAWDLPDWRHRVAEPLRALLPCQVRLERDVMLAAVAERKLGAARDRDDFAVLWLGAGIGCAMFMGGRPLRGASGGAGQIGYLPVPGAPVLPVIHSGDAGEGYGGGLQSQIGARAIQDLAAQYGQVLESAGQTIAAASPELIKAVAERISVGLIAVCTLADPGLVVLSGDVGRSGGVALAEAVGEIMTALCPTRSKVITSGLTGDDILLGAITSAVTDARDVLWGGAGSDGRHG
jgi:predicted NBD/HSP70 family sugar kinase